MKVIHEKLFREIAEYAKKKNISIEEAAEKAYITVNGQKIEPFKIENSEES